LIDHSEAQWEGRSEAKRADLLRRLGRSGEAAQAYRQALALAALEPERRYLQSRLLEL
jgi:RNA polymerase sigma-70 factor (ECF subfamily)